MLETVYFYIDTRLEQIRLRDNSFNARENREADGAERRDEQAAASPAATSSQQVTCAFRLLRPA